MRRARPMRVPIELDSPTVPARWMRSRPCCTASRSGRRRGHLHLDRPRIVPLRGPQHHGDHLGDRRALVTALRQRVAAAQHEQTAPALAHEVVDHEQLIVREEARLHVVEGGPHFPNRTHRAEVQHALRAWLDDLGL